MRNRILEVAAMVLVGALMAYSQQLPRLGMAFQAVQVSDLERSVRYYRALGFSLADEGKSQWINDEAENRLYNTPAGALSRTAVLTMPGSASGAPFALLLREYKGFDRGSRANFPARNPSAAHFGIMVPDADALWGRLKSAGLLRALSWDEKLVRMPGQTSGGIAYVMDPDGFSIEIIGVGAEPPQPSLHHLGLAVLDSVKAKSFYAGLLGARFPEKTADWLSGDMYDAAVGGRGFVIRLMNGNFPQASAPAAQIPFELVEYQKPTRNDVDDYRYSDVAVSCVGFQVSGLDLLFERLKAAGITVWSQGGMVQKKDGTRAVVVRDPDVGAYVELFEAPK